MSKAQKWLVAILLLVFLALVGLIVGLLLSYTAAQNTVAEEAMLTLEKREDGSLRLSWPASKSADHYYVSVSALRDGTEGERLFLAVYDETEALLPSWLPEDAALLISVSSIKDYRFLGIGRERLGSGAMTVAAYLNPPKAENVTASVDLNHAAVRVNWNGWQGDRYRLYRVEPDGTRTLLRELEHVGTELSFGAGAELEIPEYGTEQRFVIEPFRESESLRFIGCAAEFSLRRSAFLGEALELECTDEGENAYTLRWNETRSNGYRVLRVDPVTGTETVMAEYGPTEERIYRTGHLEPYTDVVFRVVALGDETLPDGVYAGTPAETEIRTGARLMYAAVWPLRELDIYAGPGSGEKLGKMTLSEAWCVTGETDGWLQISTPTLTGYVDGNLCMINLPDYIGDLCAYDITNSYSAAYRVHEYDIPRVSGTVVSGYENVRLSEGEYLVPLLYPTAEKLIRSAQKAADDGYRLKIYDSFRPNQATRSVYDLTELVLYSDLPERTYNGQEVETGGAETFYQLMTNGVYSLGSIRIFLFFLPNVGIAMDLTLETTEGGEEQRMQTALHDLSWYSASAFNNLNANHLRNYMKYGGFGGLSSEWWHYQDNDAMSSFALSNRWYGVMPRGWTRDDAGWRYRLVDGSFLATEEREIDGTLCRFDADGYLIQ